MKNFSKNSNLDEADTFLLDLSSRTDLELNNNLVTPELAKKVIINLDSSKASLLNCIPVVTLKKCLPELSS